MVGLQESPCGRVERGSRGSMVGVEAVKSAGFQGKTIRALEGLAKDFVCYLLRAKGKFLVKFFLKMSVYWKGNLLLRKENGFFFFFEPM